MPELIHMTVFTVICAPEFELLVATVKTVKPMDGLAFFCKKKTVAGFRLAHEFDFQFKCK